MRIIIIRKQMQKQEKQTNEQTNEGTNVRAIERQKRTNEPTNERNYFRTNARTDTRTRQRSNEWTNQRANERINQCTNERTHEQTTSGTLGNAFVSSLCPTTLVFEGTYLDFPSNNYFLRKFCIQTYFDAFQQRRVLLTDYAVFPSAIPMRQLSHIDCEILLPSLPENWSARFTVYSATPDYGNGRQHNKYRANTLTGSAQKLLTKWQQVLLYEKVFWRRSWWKLQSVLLTTCEWTWTKWGLGSKGGLLVHCQRESKKRCLQRVHTYILIDFHSLIYFSTLHQSRSLASHYFRGSNSTPYFSTP